MLAPGTRVGPFVVESLLGSGGMGVVHVARHERTGERVALKVLAQADPELLERFARETLIARRMAAHPDVVAIKDAGAVRGYPWLALELVTGGSLAAQLSRGRLPWQEAALHGAAVARALAALHAAGIVHRDVKPANVLLDGQGRAKLSDFGVARTLDSRSLTETGTVVGTLEYAAPEQLAASPRVDARADLYGLGATLHALLAGEPPFRGTPLELARKHAAERPSSVRLAAPEVPPRLEQLVKRLLAKDPATRGDAASVARELAEIAEAKDARPGNRRVLAGALALLLLAGAGLALAWRHAPRSPLGPPPTPVVATLASPAATPASPAATIEAETAAIKSLLKTERGGAALERAQALVASYPLVGHAHYALALVLMAKGDDGGATAAIERALTLDPRNGRHWSLRALCRVAAQDLTGALSDVESALALNPRDPAAFEARGRVHLEQGLAVEARADFLHAIDATDGVLALEELSPRLFALGDSGRALYALDRAVALAPEQPEVLALRANLKARLGDLEGALADTEAALAREPNRLDALETRRSVLLGLHRFPEALDAAEAMLAAAPGLATALLGRANARFYCADFKGTIADVDRALALSPDEPDAFYLRALARSELHDDKGAREDARRFAELSPGRPELTSLLETLERNAQERR
jgi:serine/threonine-protein kinase